MQEKLTLMIPGPTPVPESVLRALGKHPIGHRSSEFQEIYLTRWTIRVCSFSHNCDLRTRAGACDGLQIAGSPPQHRSVASPVT